MPLDIRLLAAALGSWASAVAVIRWGYTGTAIIAAVVVAGALTCVALCARQRTTSVTVIPTALCAITAWAVMAAIVSAHTAALKRDTVIPDGRDSVKTFVHARIVSDPVPIADGRSQLVTVRLSSVGRETKRRAARSLATLIVPSESVEHLSIGQTIAAGVTAKRPPRRDLTAAVMTTRGQVRVTSPPPWYYRVSDTVRTGLFKAVAPRMTDEHIAILIGMSIGDTTYFSAEQTEQFKALGLQHLTAVSGSNFVIVCAAVLLTVRMMGVHTSVAVGVTIVAAVGFAILVHPSPSVVRAAVMAIVGLLSLVAARKRQAFPALCVSIIGLLMWQPQWAINIGFVLSVAATAALILFAVRLTRWLQGCKLRGLHLPRSAATVLAVTVIATAATAVPLYFVNESVNAAAPIANIAVSPVVPVVTVVGTLAAVVAVISPSAAGLIASSVQPMLWWINEVANRGTLWCDQIGGCAI